MNNNKKKHALTSFAKSVLAELIRQLPMQIDVWRLEKKLDRLKAQNLELTSRLAAIESGMAHTLGDVPVRFQTDDENGTDDISTGLTLSDKKPEAERPAEEPKKERGIGPSEVFLSFYHKDMGLLARHALAGNDLTEDASELNAKLEEVAKSVAGDTDVPVKIVVESRETEVSYEVAYRKNKFPHADVCVIDPRHYGTKTESTFNAGRTILRMDGKCKGGWTYPSEAAKPESEKRQLMFRIHDANYNHVGQVNLHGRIFCNDMEELNTAIRRAADLIKRQFNDPSLLRIVSDVTGRAYVVIYDEGLWPATSAITLMVNTGDEDEKRYTFQKVQNAAAWIIKHDIRPDMKWAYDEQQTEF